MESCVRNLCWVPLNNQKACQEICKNKYSEEKSNENNAIKKKISYYHSKSGTNKIRTIRTWEKRKNRKKIKETISGFNLSSAEQS